MSSPMECEGVRIVAGDLIGAGSRESQFPEVSAHIAECENCREFLGGLEDTVSLLARAGVPCTQRTSWPALSLLFQEAVLQQSQRSSATDQSEADIGGHGSNEWLDRFLASSDSGVSAVRRVASDLVSAGWSECGNRPSLALALASSALNLIRRCEKAIGPGFDLIAVRASCLTLVGNARRVKSDLRGALEAFREVDRIQNEHHLASEERVRILHSRALLSAEFREFDKALSLLEQAIALAEVVGDGAMMGRLQVSKAAQLGHAGKYEDALRVLDRAMLNTAVSSNTYLTGVVQHNRILFLCECGRLSESLAVLESARSQGQLLENEVIRARLSWVEGKIAMELEKWEEAESFYMLAMRYFEDEEMLFDYALVSLDLAVLCLRIGTVKRARVIACDVLRAFQALRIERECLTALALLGRAVELDELTLGIVSRVTSALKSSRPAV